MTTAPATLVAERLARTDLDVTPLVLGGNMLGGRLSADESFALLDAYAAAGGTMVDTAAVYADWLENVERGCSERTLGRYLAARPGSPLLVATKGGHPSLDRPDVRRLDAESLRDDVAQSLDRLGLGALPLWVAHRDDPDRPVEEILGPVEALRAEGQVRWYGVSNWSTSRVREAVRLRDSGALPGFVATQCAFAAVPPAPGTLASDLVAADGAMLDLHRDHGLTLMAYSAQAKGWFAGAEGARATYDTPANRETRREVAQVAAEVGAEPGQVALAVLLGLDLPLRLVVGCSSPARLAEALGAVGLRLDDDQQRRVVAALPVAPGAPSGRSGP